MPGQFLVMGATNDEALNRQIHADAAAHGVLCNIADRPDLCQFILPAVVRRGDLVLTVSTSGQSPAMAKRLRRQLQVQFGEAYAGALKLLGAVRRQLLAQAHAPEAHKDIFEHLLDAGIVDLVQTGRTDAIQALLHEVLTPGQVHAVLDAWQSESRGPTGNHRDG
jgi:precorrin-2 dehydrogenase/sirohydrochlorin ferrochelatase